MANTLKELLDMTGNTLNDGVLTIRDIGSTKINKINDPSIEKVITYVDDIYMFLDGDKKKNNLRIIEVMLPFAKVALKNVHPDCIIASKGEVGIDHLKLTDASGIRSSIVLGKKE